MTPFTITDLQKTTLTNLNIRTEKQGSADDGSEPEKELAIDLSIRAENVPMAIIEALIGDTAEALEQLFWNDGGKIVCEAIKVIPIDRKFEDAYQVHIGGMSGVQDRATRIHKFKITPRGGKVFDLAFQIQVAKPTDEFFEAAKDAFTKESVLLRLEALQSDLLDDAA